MNEGLNPVTIRGWRSPHDFRERAFTLGRLGINTGVLGGLAEGQHRFDPNKGHQTIEWTMQFVIWDEPSEPLAFMIAQEGEFVREIKPFLQGKVDSFLISGNERRGKETKATLKIAKLNDDKDGMATVSLFEGKAIIPQRVVVSCFDLERFQGGLELLFPNSELE